MTKKKSPAYKLIERTTTVIGAIADAYSELSTLLDEMTEKRDAMEEKFSSTQRYQDTSDCVDALEQADVDNEPDVPEAVRDISVKYSESVPTRKSRGTSRSVRCSNSVAMLQAAKDMLEGWSADSEVVEVAEEVESLIETLGSAITYLDGIDFPGMY